MFTSITWSNYFTALLILAIAWYIIIAIMYYRKEIFNLLQGKYKTPFKKKTKVTPESEESEEDSEHTFDELEGIVTDIRHSILEEAGKEANKAELLKQLQQRLANYGGLRQPAFRMAINNFIIQYGESICGVAFSEDELDAAWEALPR
jgi:hypothetical protein